MTLLAKNEDGLKNLMRLSTIAETKGRYRKPRVDFDILSQHSKGLICLSGCPAGELANAITDQDDNKIKRSKRGVWTVV